ncbi:MAG TPA: hypothetical protein VLB45_05195 [Nitrosopumilaceae archaeon]|nr:hypothetical protein [Nitrosopumilaceae archaeon]
MTSITQIGTILAITAMIASSQAMLMGSAMATVVPSEVNEAAQAGDEFIINKEVTTPTIPPKLDLLFLEDESGSFIDDIATIQGAAVDCSDGLAAEIWDGISAAGVDDLNAGVAGFVDFAIFPYGAAGDHVYRLVQDMTADRTTWLNGICGLSTKNGVDFPEAQLPALHTAAVGTAWDSNNDGDTIDPEDTPAGSDPTWRADTDVTRVVVLVTDADFHDSAVEPAYPGTSFADTVSALNGEGIHVIVLTAGAVVVYDPLADATGGSVKPISSDSSDIVSAIIDALEELETDVWFEIDPASCAPELDVSLVPEVHLGIPGDTTVAFTETITIPDGTIGGEYLCEVDFFANTFGPDGDGVNIGTETILIDVNNPPDCDDAAASIASLWPPNHQMHEITIEGVTDPDGDAVTLTISSIFQDEPTDGLGDGDVSPDASGVGTDTAQIRAERSGLEDGRVYHVAFNADDGQGGICSSTVTVGVPHDKNDVPVDGGSIYDSTLP